MKKIAPLILFVVFTVFAQQQNTTPPPHTPVPTPPISIPQDPIPEPAMPLVPAQPIPEQLVPTAQPQPPAPVSLPKDPKDTLPLPPLPPLPPMPLPDTLSTPAPTDSASVVPTPTPTPLPQDTTPVAPPKIDSASIAPAPAPVPKDTTPPKPSMPMNTITIDLGPTIIGVGIDVAAKTLGKKMKNVEISAMGFAAQYEFQPIRFLSLPLKFAYMNLTTKVKEEKTFTFIPPPLPDSLQKAVDSLRNVLDSLQKLPLPNNPLTDSLRNQLNEIDSLGKPIDIPLETDLKAKLSIWSMEAHPRLYPFGGSFFLEGMVGYANLTTGFKGNANVKIKIPEKLSNISGMPADTVYKIDVNHEASRGYLKYGGKLGWRVDFGKPGGFIFEHALGFYGAKGLGKTIVKQLADYAEGEVAKIIDDKYKGNYQAEPDTKKFDDAFSLLEKFIFIGGPRYTFAFGWRF